MTTYGLPFEYMREKKAMLENSKVTSVLPVRNIEECKKFYHDKLGLETKKTLPSGEVVFACNGSEIMLRPMKDAKPTGLTEVSFNVKDINKEVEELESKGVRFEDYTEPEFKTDSHHIHSDEKVKSAWFKDPSGNVLCVHQFLA